MQWAAIRTNGFAWYLLGGPYRFRWTAELRCAGWPRVRIVPWRGDAETTLSEGVASL